MLEKMDGDCYQAVGALENNAQKCTCKGA